MAETTSEAPRTWTRSPFLAPLALIFGLYWMAAAVIAALDPLDLYPWGAPPNLDADFNRHEAYYLLSAAAKADVEVLMLGGSTLARVKNADLRRAFGVERALNLSMSMTRPVDRRYILEMVVEHSPADRVVIGLDWVFALPDGIARENSPDHLFDETPLNDLRLVSPLGLHLAWQQITGAPLGPRSWRADGEDALDDWVFGVFQKEVARGNLKRLAPMTRALSPGAVTLPGAATCTRYPLVSEALRDAAAALTARGVTVDILVPPFALRAYRTWNYRTTGVPLLVRPFLASQLMIRGCAVAAIRDLPGARVFAFDNETEITGDLTKFRDSIHLYDMEVYNHLLDEIAAGRHTLDAVNFSAYAQTLVANVEAQ
ncbi:MAG: hypothetical protein AAGI70_03155 [Pseudomonadota bacterium]